MGKSTLRSASGSWAGTHSSHQLNWTVTKSLSGPRWLRGRIAKPSLLPLFPPKVEPALIQLFILSCICFKLSYTWNKLVYLYNVWFAEISEGYISITTFSHWTEGSFSFSPNEVLTMFWYFEFHLNRARAILIFDWNKVWLTENIGETSCKVIVRAIYQPILYLYSVLKISGSLWNILGYSRTESDHNSQLSLLTCGIL